ncbi:hypothetical protein ACTFIR_012827 [Dictyostelium discoideum]
MLNKRIDFLIDIKRLKDSVQFESITLEKAYLYFKYIVRGKMNDPNTLGYYSEMDSMFSKLTREEKNSYGFNDSSADALDNYNSYDFSGLPQKVLGSKDHLPEIISEFTTLLKSRDLQNLTTGTKADDPDYINQRSIILEHRIRRNNLYDKLNAYRKERKDISGLLDAYEKEEKIQNTDHLYSLIEKQANEEKKVETIYSRLNNFNSGYFETNLSKYHVSEIEQEISKSRNISEQLDSKIVDIINNNPDLQLSDKTALKKYFTKLKKPQSIYQKDKLDPVLETSENISNILKNYLLGNEIKTNERDYLFKELKKNIPIESLPISRLLKNTFTNDEDNKTINEFLQNGKTKWIEKIEELNNMYFSQYMDNTLSNVNEKSRNENEQKRKSEIIKLVSEWFDEDKSKMNLIDRQKLERLIVVGNFDGFKRSSELLKLDNKHETQREQVLNEDMLLNAIEQKIIFYLRNFQIKNNI